MGMPSQASASYDDVAAPREFTIAFCMTLSEAYTTANLDDEPISIEQGSEKIDRGSID